MSIWRVLGIHCVILKAAAGALEQPGDPRWPQICTDEHWGTASIVWGWPTLKVEWWLLKMAIYSGFSHEKWWFSIVMLVYQRVHVCICTMCIVQKSIYTNIVLYNRWCNICCICTIHFATSKIALIYIILITKYHIIIRINVCIDR